MDKLLNVMLEDDFGLLTTESDLQDLFDATSNHDLSREQRAELRVQLLDRVKPSPFAIAILKGIGVEVVQ